MPRNDSWKLEGEKMQPGVVAANPIPRRRRPSPRRLQIGSNASPTRQLSDEGGRSLSGGRRHAVLSGLGGLARPLPDDTRAYTSPSPSSTWRAPPLSAHDLHPVSTRLDFGNRVEYRPVPHRSPPPPPPLPPPNRAQVTIRSAWTGGDAAESPQAEAWRAAHAAHSALTETKRLQSEFREMIDMLNRDAERNRAPVVAVRSKGSPAVREPSVESVCASTSPDTPFSDTIREIAKDVRSRPQESRHPLLASYAALHSPPAPGSIASALPRLVSHLDAACHSLAAACTIAAGRVGADGPSTSSSSRPLPSSAFSGGGGSGSGGLDSPALLSGGPPSPPSHSSRARDSRREERRYEEEERREGRRDERRGVEEERYQEGRRDEREVIVRVVQQQQERVHSPPRVTRRASAGLGSFATTSTLSGGEAAASSSSSFVASSLARAGESVARSRASRGSLVSGEQGGPRLVVPPSIPPSSSLSSGQSHQPQTSHVSFPSHSTASSSVDFERMARLSAAERAVAALTGTPSGTASRASGGTLSMSSSLPRLSALTDTMLNLSLGGSSHSSLY